MILLVCPAHAVAAICASERPSHVISLVSPGDAVPRLHGGPARLTLVFNDIVAPRPGLVPPDAADIDALLGFARRWDGAQPLLVHCAAGISRSVAAAFAIACDRVPERPERDLARALRSASPYATPNARMVALADRQLRRAGRMRDAISALGRGIDWVPDTSFRLDIPASREELSASAQMARA